jgi:hypothetical protein
MEKLLEDRENTFYCIYTGQSTAERPSRGKNRGPLRLQSGSWRLILNLNVGSILKLSESANTVQAQGPLTPPHLNYLHVDLKQIQIKQCI